VTAFALLIPSYSGRSLGRAGGPAGCGHSKLARARTGLPLTSVQFINVTEVVTKSVTKKRNEIFLRRPLKLKFRHAFVVGIWRLLLVSILKISQDWQSLMLPNVGETHRCVYLKRVNGANAIAMWLVKVKIQSGRLFQHPPAAILNYHFAQTTLVFHISYTKKGIKNYNTSQILLF